MVAGQKKNRRGGGSNSLKLAQAQVDSNDVNNDENRIKMSNTEKKRKKKKKKKINNRERKYNDNDNDNDNDKNETSSIIIIWSVLVVLVAVSVKFGYDHYNNRNFNSNDEKVTEFLTKFVCQHPKGFCHDSLVPHERTHIASHDILDNNNNNNNNNNNEPKKSTSSPLLLKIPRSLLIWDLDALRDPQIQKTFGKARHKSSGMALDGGAFLTLLLIQRFIINDHNIGTAANQQQQHQHQHQHHQTDPLLPYFNILPKNISTHPLTWVDEQVRQMLHGQSHAYVVYRAYRDMLRSEYDSLFPTGKWNDRTIPVEQYTHYRVLVLTRSFGTGLPKNVDTVQLDQIRRLTGVNLTRGCRSMVPILDMYDHHANPNVEWKYDFEQEAFLIRSSKHIPAGSVIYDSYGKYTDAHLFAKFGFVNGDGTDYTEVSLATMHRMMDVGLHHQFRYIPPPSTTSSIRDTNKVAKGQMKLLARYLQFDDGYQQCVGPQSPEEHWKLKQLKLLHLTKIANTPRRWIVNVPPRNGDGTGGPSFKGGAPVEMDPSKLLALCRLMALNNQDFDGDAINVLAYGLKLNKADEFYVPNMNDRLEYRAHICITRLTGLALHRYGKPDVSKETERVMAMDRGSPEWTASHVRLGEIQTMEVLNQMAVQGSHHYGQLIANDTNKPIHEIETVRKYPCGWNLSEILVKTVSAGLGL